MELGRALMEAACDCVRARKKGGGREKTACGRLDLHRVAEIALGGVGACWPSD